jgi:hypothetical protein
MNAQMLLTAAELGVFDSMAEGPRSTAEIAATGVSEDSTARLLTALCAMELVQKLPDGCFVNGTEAAEQLVRGRPRYLGAMFPSVKHALYPTWRYFQEALHEERCQWERAFAGQIPPNEDMYADPGALRRFMEGMHHITYQAAEFAASATELPDIHSIAEALYGEFPEGRAGAGASHPATGTVLSRRGPLEITGLGKVDGRLSPISSRRAV